MYVIFFKTYSDVHLKAVTGNYSLQVLYTHHCDLFNRLWDCPEGDFSNSELGSIIYIVARELE